MDLVLGHEQIEPGGGVRGGGEETVDHVLLGQLLHDALGRSGGERQGVDPLAGVLDHHDPAEPLAPLLRVEDRLEQLLYAGVDAARDRDSAEQPLPNALGRSGSFPSFPSKNIIVIYRNFD